MLYGDFEFVGVKQFNSIGPVEAQAKLLGKGVNDVWRNISSYIQEKLFKFRLVLYKGEL